MASSPITSSQIDGKTIATVTGFIFLGSRITVDGWLQPWNKKMLAPWKKNNDKPRQHILKKRHYFANKGRSSQSYGFSCSQVWMCMLDNKKCWAPKNWWFWTVFLEKDPDSHADSKEIKPVNPKASQPWIFIGKTDAKAATPVFWLPDAKSRHQKRL